METAENKRRLPKWAVNLLIWCMPALVLLSVFICKLNPILDRSIIATLCLILLIGLVVTRFIFLLRSHRAVWAKIWRAVVWVVLLASLVFLIPFFPMKRHRCILNNAQSQFEESVSKVFPGFLSAPLELGPVNSVEYHTYMESVAIWTMRSYTLLCRYDPSDYEAAKAALETKHSFRTELLNTGVKGIEVEPYVSIGNDFFRLLWPLDGDKESWEFYKESLFMVTNDVEHRIGFIVFQDIDLDEAKDMAEFINDYCGWKYIR